MVTGASHRTTLRRLRSSHAEAPKAQDRDPIANTARWPKAATMPCCQAGHGLARGAPTAPAVKCASTLPLSVANCPPCRPLPPAPPNPRRNPPQGSFDGGKGRSKVGHSATSTADAVLCGGRPSGATESERVGSAYGLRHSARTVSLADSGESACPVSPAAEQRNPLALSPPEAVGGVVRLDRSPCRARTSLPNEGRGRNPLDPPSKYARVRPARHCGRTVLRAC